MTWPERPDVTKGMYEVACEAYPDIPGEEDTEMEPFEQWLSMDLQGSGEQAGGDVVALADGEVVAYAKLALSLARPTVAMHDITGVSAPGVAAGLRERSRRPRSRGPSRTATERLETQNEERNEPIRRLDQRHGYVVEPAVTVRGPLLRRQIGA